MNDLKAKGQKIVRSLQLDFEPNEYWTHYKGGVYQFLTLSVKEDTGEVLVIYQSLKYGSVWARTLANFTEDVILPTGSVPKFKRGAP